MPKKIETHSTGSAWYKCIPRMALGEAPIYRASDSTLHWVDCHSVPPTLSILSIDPISGAPIGSARVLPLADSVSVLFFRRDYPGSYICAYYQGIAHLNEKTGELTILKEIISTEERSEKRFNDGGIDALGRFWLAEIDMKAMAYGANGLPESYGRPKGRLWRFDPDGELNLMMEDGLVCGNGVAWSPDNKTMYLNDSVGMKTYSYGFDLESGRMSNERLLIDRRTSDGEPDGMVLDIDGNLWMSVYATSRVMVFDPAGQQLKEIVLPAANPTCPTWGGKNFDILFVTTASDNTPEATSNDQGGHMFSFKPVGARGNSKREFPS